jgi:hypothetical protein
VYTKYVQSQILNTVRQAIEDSLAVTLGRPIDVRLDVSDDPTHAVLALDLGEESVRFDVQVKSAVTSATCSSAPTQSRWTSPADRLA